MQINTLFQLAAHDREELGRARRLLMLPELLVYELTGAALGERTSAGTTGLVDLTTGDWATELLSAIGVDPAIVPAISRAPAFGGEWRSANGQRVPVHLVGGHDTASAIAALPSPLPDAAFISSGTWMLVGTERGAPDVTNTAMRANFSNEPGVLGGVRLLKNVMGLWMLEQCRAQWGDPPLGDVMARAGQIAAGGPTCDATDPRFLAPLDMEAEVRAAAALPPSASREVVARCILDSLAAAAAKVVRELEELTGVRVPEICIVGGGSRNTLLNALIEQAAGVPVRTGAVEATLLGNALVQGVGLGMFESLAEARAALRS
jgi:rhamnulokinase